MLKNEPFCVKIKVIGYAIFGVGCSKQERRKKKPLILSVSLILLGCELHVLYRCIMHTRHPDLVSLDS